MILYPDYGTLCVRPAAWSPAGRVIRGTQAKLMPLLYASSLPVVRLVACPVS